jgi:hypothetical protein
MYRAEFIADNGKTFRFGIDHDIAFDISPLSGVDVILSTSQGFQQIGESVQGASVKGVRRTITGKCLTSESANALLSFLPVFTSGRLVINGDLWCPATVSKTPTVSFRKNGSIPFTMQIFCESPFWYSSQRQHVSLNEIKGLFKFPVNYGNPHKFGARLTGSSVNVRNDGDVSAPFELTLKGIGSATNYGIVNTMTGESLIFEDTLNDGDTVRFFREGGKIRAEKTSGGETFGALAYVSDSSSLFDLHAGDNLVRVTAEDGGAFVTAFIDFNSAYMGVVV